MFLTVVITIGLGQTFWCFAVICLFALFFIGKYVPETKGRDFPEIDDAWQRCARWWLARHTGDVRRRRRGWSMRQVAHDTIVFAGIAPEQ